jgi:hypothetical protein
MSSAERCKGIKSLSLHDVTSVLPALGYASDFSWNCRKWTAFIRARATGNEVMELTGCDPKVEPIHLREAPLSKFENHFHWQSGRSLEAVVSASRLRGHVFAAEIVASAPL